MLTAGAALQAYFLRDGVRGSLSDIPHLWDLRRLGPGVLPNVDRRLEYPVLIGYVVYVTSWIGRSAVAFFAVNMVVSAGLAVAASVILARDAGRRAWRWAAAPALLLYAFHNWDLWAIVPLLVGMDSFRGHRDGAAGGWLAFGAWAKLFPGLLIPPLVVSRLAARDVRGAVRIVGGAAVVTAVLNLPILVASPSGWWFPFRFQSRRHATWGAFLDYLLRLPGLRAAAHAHPASVANAFNVGILGCGVLVACVLAWRRPVSPYALGAIVTVGFVLGAKVHSPQYDLWIVPFFVLLPVARRWWLLYCALDAAVYVLVLGTLHDVIAKSTVEAWLPYLVLARAAVIVVVAWYGWRPGAASSSAGAPVGVEASGAPVTTRS